MDDKPRKFEFDPARALEFPGPGAGGLTNPAAARIACEGQSGVDTGMTDS